MLAAELKHNPKLKLREATIDDIDIIKYNLCDAAASRP